MKTLKAICATIIVALSLSVSAYADTAPGDSHTPGAPVPGTTGTPITDPVRTDSSGLPPAIDGDNICLNIADILLAFGFDLIR